MRLFFAIVLFGIGSVGFGRTLAVALPPYAEMAEALAGVEWEVVVALPRGGDHESYSPAPGNLSQLHRAEIYWASGMGFEHSLLPKLQQMSPALYVVRPLGGATGRACQGHDEHEAHDHDDLHRWLDPGLMTEDADQLTTALVALDPGNAEAYRNRNVQFKESCLRLRRDIEALLKPYSGKSIFVYHAAFGHFAHAFGLEQVALERDGREPSLKALTHLIEEARSQGVRVVYIQPQHSRASAEAVARAIGARIELLDPLAPDWSANLRRIAKQFAADFEAWVPGES